MKEKYAILKVAQKDYCSPIPFLHFFLFWGVDLDLSSACIAKPILYYPIQCNWRSSLLQLKWNNKTHRKRSARDKFGVHSTRQRQAHSEIESHKTDCVTAL